MAYTINSAKDSAGDEDQYVEAARQRQAEIQAYKAANGGDLEGAFKAVTGTPWPEGRSLKIGKSGPEMTKDRTVKSVLGKYVLPIAAAAATPFVPGLLPAVMQGLSSAGGAVSGAVSSLAGAGKNMLSGTGLLQGVGAGGGPGPAPGGGSLLAGLGRRLMGDAGSRLLGAAGNALTAGSANSAANRGEQLKASDYEQYLREDQAAGDMKRRVDAEKSNRDSGVSAFRDMQAASYVKNRTQDWAPGTTASGVKLGDYGTGYKASTPEMVANATAYESEVSKRLQGGPTIATPAPLVPYTQDEKLLNPSGAEKYGGIAGAGLSTLQRLMQNRTAPVNT